MKETEHFYRGVKKKLRKLSTVGSQKFNLGRPEGLPFCVLCFEYMLENPSGTFYVGQTANLAARLADHQAPAGHFH